ADAAARPSVLDRHQHDVDLILLINIDVGILEQETMFGDEIVDHLLREEAAVEGGDDIIDNLLKQLIMARKPFIAPAPHPDQNAYMTETAQIREHPVLKHPSNGGWIFVCDLKRD